MGFVSSLKFDEHRGAVLVNEEFMNARYRRKFYLDVAQSLLTPEMSDAWGLEAVYAGCGSPSVNQDIIDATRGELAERWAKQGKGKKKKAPPAPTLQDVADIAGRALQSLIRRDVNLKLRLFYGFDADDLNRGSFQSDGKSIAIKQEKVKAKAHDVVAGKHADRNSTLYNATRALIFGHDARYGICAYHLDISNGNLAFNQEAYEALGDGKYALGCSFSRLLNNVSWPMLKEGMKPVEGIYELIVAALNARECFNATGGNVNIVYLDGEGKGHDRRYREFVDERSRLATHVVQAATEGYVSKDEALELLDAALFADRDRKAVEKALFEAATDADALDLVLRGYKTREVARMAGEWTGTGKKAPAKSSRKRRK